MPTSQLSSAPSFTSISDVALTLAIVGIELALLAAGAAVLQALATWSIRRTATLRGDAGDLMPVLQARVRALVFAGALAKTLGVVGFNGWLVFSGVGVKDYTFALLGSVNADMWIGAAIAFGKLAALALGLFIVVRILLAARRGISLRKRHHIRWCLDETNCFTREAGTPKKIHTTESGRRVDLA